MPIPVPDVAALRDRLGVEIAASDWMEVTQEQIDRFAEATGDRQWIHVDRTRAAAESPFGTTIAHGFLTLSLVSAASHSAMTFTNVPMAINYGLNRVRFVSPVPSGSRVRGHFTPVAVTTEADRSVQVTWRISFEREGGDKPCLVADWLVRYYADRQGGH
jgi:acyl dehydratase